MEDTFILPVLFNGKEMEFPARLLQYGYTFKLEIDIAGTKVLFEPDEERNWRALISYDDLLANIKLEANLLQAIAQSISELKN
jgi:hypothetical protein